MNEGNGGGRPRRVGTKEEEGGEEVAPQADPQGSRWVPSRVRSGAGYSTCRHRLSFA